MEVKDLSCLSSNKIVYCTMEVDGGDKLQTDQAEASKPWSVLRASYCVIYLIMVKSYSHSCRGTVEAGRCCYPVLLGRKPADSIVNHGRKSRGDGGTRPPRICTEGDGNDVRPPEFRTYNVLNSAVCHLFILICTLYNVLHCI